MPPSWEVNTLLALIFLPGKLLRLFFGIKRLLFLFGLVSFFAAVHAPNSFFLSIVRFFLGGGATGIR